MNGSNSLPTPTMDSTDAPARWEAWGLAALATVTLLPIWAFNYFPSTDGGAHLANADVLLQSLRSAGAGYRAYYELSHRPLPNSLGHFLLAALMLVFRPTVAEKVLVSGYVIGLPLAVRYALRAVRPRAGFLAFAAIPLSLNWILHQGFYNFCCSVIAFFVLLGYWLRHREAMDARRAVVLGLLGLLLYAGHLLSIVLACAAIFILAGWFTLAAWWSGMSVEMNERPPLWPGVRSRIGMTFIALLPAIALVAWFQLGGFAGKPGKTQIALLRGEFWRNLMGLSILVSYRVRPERFMGWGTAALFVGMLVCKAFTKGTRREWRAADGLILVPMAFAGLYFLRGDPASAMLFIPQRLIFYTYLTLLPFLAAQSFAKPVRVAIVVISVGLALAITWSHVKPFRAYNEQLAEFVDTAKRIDNGSTLLPLIMAPRGMPQVSDTGLTVVPFYTAAGYAAIERKAVDLRNYEAGLDYFPVRYKVAVNPYKHLGVVAPPKLNGLDDVPQRFDIARYERETPGRVDWVVIWGVGQTFSDPMQAATAADIARQLEEGYRLTYTSPSGRSQLWQRKR